MKHEEALAIAVHGDPTRELRMEEKYNSMLFTFGIEDGVPDPDGMEWVGEIDSTYGHATGWSFRPVREFLKDRWPGVSEDYLDDMLSEGEVAAWQSLGYDFPAREA